MNLFSKWIVALACGAAVSAQAQLKLWPAAPPCVFGGNAADIGMIWSNTSSATVSVDLRARLWQASSATGAPWKEAAWKGLTLLPHQAALESASLTFPSVKSETLFLVQWIDDHDALAGLTEVRVFPTNLLAPLQTLAGGNKLGILDPDEMLSPVLVRANIESEDLGARELDSFDGRLAILGFFRESAKMEDGFPQRVERLAKKGAAVVWIRPAEDSRALEPDFYRVPMGRGAVVVANAKLVTPLAENPSAQINLARLAEAAFHIGPPSLPTSAP